MESYRSNDIQHQTSRINAEDSQIKPQLPNQSSQSVFITGADPSVTQYADQTKSLGLNP
jgi:hypothetical protein